MYTSGQPLTYDFTLDQRNVLGTLGFQLLLSGTSEEILYRALPITVLVLSPFAADANISQLFYAFAIGSVQGMAYQESRSVLYPVLMHSVSNVLMVGVGYLFAVLV